MNQKITEVLQLARAAGCQVDGLSFVFRRARFELIAAEEEVIVRRSLNGGQAAEENLSGFTAEEVFLLQTAACSNLIVPFWLAIKAIKAIGKASNDELEELVYHAIVEYQECRPLFQKRGGAVIARAIARAKDKLPTGRW